MGVAPHIFIPKIHRVGVDELIKKYMVTMLSKDNWKADYLRKHHQFAGGQDDIPDGGHAIAFFRDTGLNVPFTANGLVTREMTNLGMVWREMYLELNGQLTVTSGNNVPANMFPGDEWAVVNEISLRINGRDVYKRIDGPSLRWLQYYLYGVFPLKSLNLIGNGTTTNPTFQSTLILPFWMPKSSHPMDFAFDTSKVSRVDLEINWNNYTAINSAATGFTVNPYIHVYDYEVANVGGNFARWNIFPVSRQFPGAGTTEQIRIPVGFLYRSFLINDPSEIISVLRLQSWPNEWVELPIEIVRDVIGNARRNSVIPTAFANLHWLAGAPGDDIYHYYYFDNIGHGHNVESIDTYGLSEFYMNVDVTGSGNVTIYPSQLVVPRG